MSSGGGLVKIAGVDKDALRKFYEIDVDPEVWEEFKSRRNGALLGAGITALFAGDAVDAAGRARAEAREVAGAIAATSAARTMNSPADAARAPLGAT